MHYDYLAAKGQSIILLNCVLSENWITCGCAVFFTNTPQKIYYGKELIKNGRRLLLPKDLQIETYALLSAINDDIKLFFENLNE